MKPVSILSLTVHAGDHHRRQTPVKCTIDQPIDIGDGKACLDLLNDKGNVKLCIPAQIGTCLGDNVLYFIVDDLPAGQSQTYKLCTGDDAKTCSPRQQGVELTDDPGTAVEVKINGTLFTRYIYSEQYVRPFMYPVIGPYGKPVTRELEGRREDGFDHPHHKSLYVAHGMVNDADCWSEEQGHGFVRHREFDHVVSGPVLGMIGATNEWQNAAGNKVLEQTSHITYYATSCGARIIDHDISFLATEGDVTFGDTKEGGILSVRVIPTMNASRFGVLSNSDGGVNEDEVWGKRASWCDYSGPAHGDLVGITVMNHPRSYRYPTYWHARNYGLMTANPFGLSHFLGEGHDGTCVVKDGEHLNFAYRIYIHPGDAETGRCREAYHDYVNPPRVTVG